MIGQTVVKPPPPSGQPITRDHLTCKIQYSANGKQGINVIDSGVVLKFAVGNEKLMSSVAFQFFFHIYLPFQRFT